MFTFSSTITRIALSAAATLVFAGAVNAQTIGGNTVVGGFAKNGGAVRAAELKTGIENLSGQSLDNVQVHRGSPNPTNIGARAYAKGTNIHFGPGQAKHLPHEAWHVVNQTQGRVRPSGSVKPVNGPSRWLQAKGSAGGIRNAARPFNPNASMADDVISARKRAGQARKSAAGIKNTGQATKSVRFANTARNAKTAGTFASKAKSAQTIAKSAKSANVARHANSARKTLKTANAARKVGKAALMGTGVGAVVGVTAGLAGVDPVDLAVLKATDPAAYNAKMAALKKNPVKYMGDNIKNNTVKTAKDIGNATKKAGKAVGNATRKAAANVGKATKTAANKVGCGVGNIFKKKADKNKC